MPGDFVYPLATLAAHRSRRRGASIRQDGPEGTLAAVELAVVVEALGRLGYPTDPLFEAAGLRDFSRSDAFARVEMGREHDLWAAAERLTNDPAIGLRVGVEHAHNGVHNVLEYLIVHAPTLRQALESVQKLVPLVDDLAHLDVVEDRDFVSVGIRRDGIDRALGYVDSLCAAAFVFYSEHVDGFQLEAIRFTREKPRVVRPYVNLFGMMPVFSAAQNQLVFPRRFLDGTLRGGDPVIGDLLNQHATRLLAETPETDAFIDAVRRAIARHPSPGDATPAAVARAVGTSTRTLRRRLSERGLSYQRLLDELRHRTACHDLLHTEASVDAVAERAGYSTRSAFQRAFRRHTGQTPSEYRANGRRNRSDTG